MMWDHTSYTCKDCLEDYGQFKLVNGKCVSSSITDKNLTNMELNIGANQSDNDTRNDPTRPQWEDKSSDST